MDIRFDGLGGDGRLVTGYDMSVFLQELMQIERGAAQEMRHNRLTNMFFFIYQKRGLGFLKTSRNGETGGKHIVGGILEVDPEGQFLADEITILHRKGVVRSGFLPL